MKSDVTQHFTVRKYTVLEYETVHFALKVTVVEFSF